MDGKATRKQLQFGALPFMIEPAGTVRVLLITSRRSGEWIIPKGWPIARLSPPETAAREAFEEAGVTGVIVGDAPIGSYDYTKRSASRRPLLFEVVVFLLEVRAQRERWPEQGQRMLRWCDARTAAGLVAEPSLARLLDRFSARLASTPLRNALI